MTKDEAIELLRKHVRVSHWTNSGETTNLARAFLDICDLIDSMHAEIETLEQARGNMISAGGFIWTHDHWEHVAPDYYGDPDVVILFGDAEQLKTAKEGQR